MPPTTAVLGLIAFAGVFLFILGVRQLRRSAGGTEDFQARLAAYGVTTAGAQALPQSGGGLRDTMTRRFHITLGSFSVIFSPIAPIIGYFLPTFYVRYRVSKRLKKFNGQLGDTLTLLSNALKAGYSFAQAIDTVAKNAVEPIGDEFGRAVREMNLGGSPDEALSNITKRIASNDFDLVATAYSIHRTVGGNLAEILDNIAYTIRERVRIKGEIQTLTAQARASGSIITALPLLLATFMFFVTPTYFQPMFSSIIGWILLAIGGFMIFIGNLIIRRIVAIEV